ERVERAAEHDRNSIVAQPELEAMRDALRRSDHREAIRRALEIKLETLEPIVLREIATKTFLAAESLLDDSEEERLGYELVVRARDLARQDGESDPLALTVARALLNLGITLSNRHEHEAALETLETLIRRFG